MYAEHLSIYDGTQTHVIENFGAVAPYVNRTILTKALVVKAINLCYLSTLMVSTDQSNTVRVSYLQRKQEQQRFYTVVPSIYEIS